MKVETQGETSTECSAEALTDALANISLSVAPREKLMVNDFEVYKIVYKKYSGSLPRIIDRSEDTEA